MYRGLFITHDISNYGASRSLQLLLQNYCYHPFDLVVQRWLRRNIDVDLLQHKYGKNLNNIEKYYLPFDNCYLGKPDFTIKQYLFSHYVNALWRYGRSSFELFLKKQHYSFIHLNSLVLHPMINSGYPTIIHVREILDDDGRSMARKSLEKAHGVIFIDEATRKPFADLRLQNWIVLNNPIDMAPLQDYPVPDLAHLGIDVNKHTIFAIIGRFTRQKGVDFVINQFKRLSSPDVRLLIVGSGGTSEEYEKMCRNLAMHDSRIIFWGEEADILRVYRIADFIIRGEDRACIGRTIYEGLYAGCDVIIPAETLNQADLFEYSTYRHKIHMYSPRNAEQFRNILENVSRTKQKQRVFRSNIEEYVDRFHKFTTLVAHR